MSYIAVPYQLLFEDTMAYGTHHYLSNFRFQCIAREHFFFGGLFDKQTFKNVVILTQQGYSRNMAPVSLGERVAIFLTFDEPSRATVRLCFRVVRNDGVPVCCGYQVLVFTSITGEIIPIPSVLTNYVMQHLNLLEQVANPTFSERVVKGGKCLNEIFTPEICELGRIFASSKDSHSLGFEIVDTMHLDPSIASIWASTSSANLQLNGLKRTTATISKGTSNSVVFMFPGQGSYDYQVLSSLYNTFPEVKAYFRQADTVTQQYFNCLFSSLAQATSVKEHDSLLQQCSELDQIGIFLLDVIVANLLIERGMQPTILVGHSFGEIAALVVGGIVDFSTGLHIVCKRLQVLRKLGERVGGMLAVTCTAEKLPQLASVLQKTKLTIAVVNHPSQIVLSGDRESLRQIESELMGQGISCNLLRSRYPFHSPLLMPAVDEFRSALEPLTFQSPKIPVYSPIQGAFLSESTNFANTLALQLVRPLNFRETVIFLSQEDVPSFIECGAGKVLSRIVQKNFLPESLNQISTTMKSNLKIVQGFEDILRAHPQNNAINELLPKLNLERSILSSISPKLSLEDVFADISMESNKDVPIAIVSMGCLLPGAGNLEQYWQNILSGVSGIIDLGELDPLLIRDFKSSEGVVPDKTYSLLSGRVPNVDYDDYLPYTLEEFACLARGQRLLAKTLGQCLTTLPIQNLSSCYRVHCLLGSTADGIEEYDEALFAESLRYHIMQLSESDDLLASFTHSIEKLLGYKSQDYRSLSPYKCYEPVVKKLLGSQAKLTLLDAACASSLHTIDVGVKMLQRQQSDLVLSGGVFAPSVAMNCLFAQFNGLSATGSRSFDASADGVVFTEGAAILALKRLSDALKDGDRIHGIIRSVGTSSDGKSAAPNVPTVAGQSLACQRACKSAGVTVDSIQYIEAHATATPVGDATEYKSLCAAFSHRKPDTEPIFLGSVKSLIGHTGWVAGVASVIKVCKALEASVIPAQYNYQSPNKEIDLEAFPFEIPKQSRHWPKNIDGQPRRAAVNAFGFGGTNANVILEAYEPGYHSQLSQNNQEHAASLESEGNSLALVGVSTLFPSAEGGIQTLPSFDMPIQRFDRTALHIPLKRRLLPDVTDDMDASQYLCVMAVQRALEGINEQTIADLKDRIGIVLGMPDKTGRGILANERIYLDRLKRILNEGRAEFCLSDADFARICTQLFSNIETANRPSSAYTLTGSMPNVAAGRVCNLFEFKGSNVVIDADTNSLVEAIRTAKLMLNSRADFDVVLAGGINGYAGRGGNLSVEIACEAVPPGEAVCVLALTSIKTAHANKMPVLALLDLVDEPAEAQTEVAVTSTLLNFRGATGAAEIAQALEHLSQTHEPVSVQWPEGKSRRAVLKFSPSENKVRRLEDRCTTSSTLEPISWRVVADSLKQNPIQYCIPSLFPETLHQPGGHTLSNLKQRKILFLSDQPDWWTEVRGTAALEGLNYAVACPANRPIYGGIIPINLSSEETIDATICNLDFTSYDTLIVLKNLAKLDSEQLLLIDHSDPLLNLLFVVSRHAYQYLKSGEMAVATVCLNAQQHELNPYTGLFAGFIKSLARELPNSICKSVNTDTDIIETALLQASVELAQKPGKPIEVCYIKGDRRVFKLLPLENVTKDCTPLLKRDSVVIATGGGRGVTAVLMEEVLRRFGCTVILLGRTDLRQVPEQILNMDEASFVKYEQEYYKEQLAQDSSQKIPILKRRYESFEAAREVAQNLQHLSTLPGQLQYISIDVTNAEAVEKLVQQIICKHGQIDLIVHGAGVQLSKLLPKRKLHEFQRVLSTKLSGLKNLHAACTRFANENMPAFHILTSAFSYIGNDGQPDYGAANEFMNRLASYMATLNGGKNWSTLAWLGWAGIGMTRGSEYAVLSRERGLRAIEAKEGQYLFTQLMNGQAASPINVLLTEGEKNYYQIDVVPKHEPVRSREFSSPSNEIKQVESIRQKEISRNGNSQQNCCRQQWRIGTAKAPYLLNHLVNGIPTLPATFEQEFAVEIALSMRPERKLIAIEKSNFTKFVKFFNNQPEKELRAEAVLLAEDDHETLIQVKLMSDFIHKSGIILEKNSVHCEMNVRLPSTFKNIDSCYPTLSEFEGQTIREPYMNPLSPVQLSGVFDCLTNLVVGTEFRRAHFRFKNPELLKTISNFATPAILIDAMLRLATSSTDASNPPIVFVPQGWKRIRLIPHLNDYQINELGQELLFIGSNSQMNGDQLRCEWLQVIDDRGQILVLMEQAIGLRKSDQPTGLQPPVLVTP